jgi:hypothetical protein
MPGLHELQRSFAAGLSDRPCDAHEWAASDHIPAAARLQVYRNNSRTLFEQALRLTYPVLLRRVGADYFRQLTHHFRSAHPARAGDLHEVGRAFAGFLAAHLAGSDYAWLADLAALEWAVADAGVAADSPIAAAVTLAALEPARIESARFTFVPSLRRVVSSVPVLSVWRANQPDGDGATIDLAAGADQVIVHRQSTAIASRSVSRSEYAFLDALVAGASLRDALDRSQLALERLPNLLHWLFADGVIAEVHATPGA